MKAYWISPSPAGTAVELRDTATPVPKPGEILVRVRAASLNRGELLGGKAGAPAKPGGIESSVGRHGSDVVAFLRKCRQGMRERNVRRSTGISEVT